MGKNEGLRLNDDEADDYRADVVLDSVSGSGGDDGCVVRRVRQGEDVDPDGLIVLRFLPPGFVDWYARLIDDGLKVERSGRGGESTVLPGVGHVTSEMRWGLRDKAPSVGPAVQGQAKRAFSPTPLGSEQAIRERDRIDRRLRKIARDIKAWYSKGAVSANRICAGRCKKIGDGEWNFCPRCGGQMRELGRGEEA
jgi:hypothetical protein